MDATTIIATTRDRYKLCHSYTDRGAASWHRSDGKFGRCSFATYFVKPRRLRFDWRLTEESVQSVGADRVWCNGTEHCWRHSDGKTDEIGSFLSSVLGESGRSLGADIGLFAAMCTAARECGGVCWKVPSIMVDEKISKGKDVLSMKEVEVLAEERVGERLCYVLRGTVFRTGDHIVWICQADFTIRRINEQSTVRGKDVAVIFEQMSEQKLRSRKFLEDAGVDLEKLSQQALQLEDAYHLNEFTYEDVAFDQEIAADIFSDADVEQA